MRPACHRNSRRPDTLALKWDDDAEIPRVGRTARLEPVSVRGANSPVELSLTSRGFGAGDPRTARLCRAKYAVVAKNAGAVSGLAKPFPGRNWRRRQRPVRWPTETGSSLARQGDG